MSQEPRACTEVLAKTLQHAQQYANIAAADMQGRVICQGIAVTPPQPFNANDGAWFQRVVARRDFVVGNYAIGRGGGERSVDTAYPIFGDNHSMIGAVYAGIRVSWLSERFAALNVPRGIVVALLDSDGTILFRHPQSELGSLTGWKMPGAAQLIAEQGKGITEVKMMNGVYRTVAFAPLGGMRWSALTVVAAAEPPPFWGTVWGLVGVHVDSAIILFLTVLAGVLGAYWLVIRPVRLLEGAVEAYASGDHSARAGEMDRGELGHLARTFNAMAERLNQQESALRVSSAQKSRYLAIASHDLRQPLQIMMMGLETGARNTEGKVRAGLERAQRAAERLQGQLDVLADVVRAEMFGADPQSRIRAVPLSDLFRRVREAHLQTAAAKGLALHVIESSLAVASNPDALYTIVNNLVINAITYTEEGRVVVGCRRVGKMCRIEVHDTGPGIPPESYARIFEAFHRLDPETGFGLGLGLTIVKETASLLGHAVSVQSTPRRGSCFRVEVPLWRIKPK
jgi:signal transduction histidine kinase